MEGMSAPILGKPILPSLVKEQIEELLQSTGNPRGKAVIALFTESGLRLSELANLRAKYVDWNNRTIRVMGKRKKEALAPFGELSARYLREWLSEYNPNCSNIWGLNYWGIVQMLKRLQRQTAHTICETTPVLPSCF